MTFSHHPLLRTRMNPAFSSYGIRSITRSFSWSQLHTFIWEHWSFLDSIFIHDHMSLISTTNLDYWSYLISIHTPCYFWASLENWVQSTFPASWPHPFLQHGRPWSPTISSNKHLLHHNYLLQVVLSVVVAKMKTCHMMTRVIRVLTSSTQPFLWGPVICLALASAGEYNHEQE